MISLIILDYCFCVISMCHLYVISKDMFRFSLKYNIVLMFYFIKLAQAISKK